MPHAIDRELQAALDLAPTLPSGPTDALDYRVLRMGYEAAGRASRTPYPDSLVVTDHRFESAGGRMVSLRLYTPQARQENAPAPGLLFLHGGGWVVGSIETHDPITAALAVRAGVIVASVDYALAPEHPHPAAIEDVEAAALWLVEHAGRLGIDAARIAVGGDSAGGNLAASACIRARDAGNAQRYAAQLLIYPAVDRNGAYDSYRRNADAPILSAALMRWFIDQYLGAKVDDRSRDDPSWRDASAFPMFAETLTDLPPTFVVTAGHDPLCDEGMAYAARLVRDGVNVTARHAPDLTHGFVRYHGASRRANEELDAACAWLSATLRESKRA